MPTTATQSAADFIWDLWQQGEVAGDLPAGLKPATRAEGYAIQACLDRRSAQPRFGWKIAATSTAGQRHIGVDGPLAGRILAERVRPDGARASIAKNRMRVAEPEFAFRLGRALPPRDAPYTTEDVMEAVETLHLAIVLPDSRFAAFAKVGGPTLIVGDPFFITRDRRCGPGNPLPPEEGSLNGALVQRRVIQRRPPVGAVRPAHFIPNKSI